MRRVILTSTILFVAAGISLSVRAQSVISATPGGVQRSLSSNYLGFNRAGSITGIALNDPNLTSGAAKLQPGSLRYPGGSVANYWDWKRGTLVCSGTDPACTTPKDVSGQFVDNTLDKFKAQIDATGAAPIYVLNMISDVPGNPVDRLTYAIQELEHARDIGLPVQFIELGNEVYAGSNPDLVRTFPTASDYVNTCKTWIAAIHAEFPAARIGAVVTAIVPQADPRGANWNSITIAGLNGIADAAIIHEYFDSGLRATFTEADVPTFLSRPFVVFNPIQTETLSVLPATMRAWFTEFNFKGDDPTPAHGTWAHGLAVATVALLYLRDLHSELAVNHKLLGDALDGALFATGGAFGVSNTLSNPPTVPFGLSASGATLQFANATLSGMNTAQEMTISPNPSLTGSLPSLIGWLFSNGTIKRGLVLNLNAQTQTVNFSSMFATANYVQLSSTPLKLITGAMGEITGSSGSFSGTLTLLPYSMTELTAPRHRATKH